MRNLIIVGGFIILVGASLFVIFGNNQQKSMTKIKPTVQQNGSQIVSRYIPYSKDLFEKNLGKKRVYFFHAKWCPTCKAADAEFSQNGNKIPDDVVLYKTDYDNEKELKTKYGITYQHTFVLVDENGNEIRKWNGGDIAELEENTQ